MTNKKAILLFIESYKHLFKYEVCDIDINTVMKYLKKYKNKKGGKKV